MSADGWPIVIGGELRAPGDAVLPVDDTGFGLGSGLFETLALRDGRPRLLQPHLDRLGRSARSLGFDLEPRATYERGLSTLVAALPVADAALRLTVSPRAARGPRWWIAARPLPERPSRVVLWPAERAVRPGDLFEQVKHTGRLAKVALRERARAAGAFDALLATTDGDFVEATVANLWVRVDGRLRTPPSGRGCLPGVVRAQLLADREGPFPTEVAPIEAADLARADEVLVTNSLQGPLGVDAVLGLRDALPGAAGAAARALAERFRAFEGR